MFLPERSDLAQEYGVSRQTIQKDLRKLGEYMDDRLGEGEALEMDPFLWKCVTDLYEKGEEFKGGKLALKLSEWRMTSELDDLLERVEALEERETGTSDFQLK